MTTLGRPSRIQHHPTATDSAVGTVLIVNGDSAQSRDVRTLAEQHGMAVREFNSLAELQKDWDWSQPSCLVTDLRKFGTNGAMQRELDKDSGPHPVIVLSGHHVPTATSAAQNRSFRWLPRPLQESDALAAIRRALDQDREHHEQTARTEEIRRRLATLTSQESSVLQMLVEGGTNKAIAKALDIAIRTVELRRHRIAKKMHARTVAELVLMVAQAGGLAHSE